MHKFKVGDKVRGNNGTIVGREPLRVLVRWDTVPTLVSRNIPDTLELVTGAQIKHREFVSVEDFGAVSDGVTDTLVENASIVDFLLALGYSITKIDNVFKIQNCETTFFIHELTLPKIPKCYNGKSSFERQLTLYSEFVIQCGSLVKSRRSISELIKTYIEGNANYA